MSKITKIETFLVPPRSVFVKVETDEGLVGWGEPSLEGRAETQRTSVAELSRFLIGQDSNRIEHLWQLMFRGDFYRGGPVMTSAISGIDQALWDLKGKRLGVPVYELLGGAVRDKIRMYRGVGYGGGESPTEGLARSTREAVEQGFTGVKFCPIEVQPPMPRKSDIQLAYEKVQAIREALPDDADVMLDFHGRLTPDAAIETINALEPLHPAFVEEPCHPELQDSLPRIANQVNVPLATGERLYTRWGFRNVIESEAVAVVQPDPCHAGGISELRRIAAMAETHGIVMAPHNPLGPVCTAVCLQLDAAIPNFYIQEHVHLGQGVLEEPFALSAGYIEIPKKPGLGIEIDEDRLRSLKWNDWMTPHLTRDDGSIHEW